MKVRLRWPANFLAASALALAPSHALAALPRPIVVISDLHFGEGKQGSDWSKFEDFRWQDDFKGFLGALRSKWPGGVDLVLNGDTFELWQSSEVPCGIDKRPELGCSERQALKRLQRALAAHQDELAELNALAQANSRVWIVPGNHDAALLFDALQKELAKTLSSPHLKVVETGVFVSQDGTVVVEHGHTIGKDPNHMESWPRPFQVVGNETYLKSPWGEQFVKQYYDAWERKYPIIDNITEELAGAGLAMKLEGVPSSLQASLEFGAFYFAGVSWPQFAGSLGEDKYDASTPLDWDTSKIDPAALVALLPADDPLRDLLAGGKVTITPAAVGEEQLRLLCDRALAARGGVASTDFPCHPKKGALGAVAEGFLRRRKEVLFEHVEKLQRKLKAAGKGPAPNIQTYVFSHTHRAEMPFAPRSDGPFVPKVVNTGAWQRLITPSQLRKRFSKAPEQALKKMKLEELPRCYHFVLVEPGSTDSPQLLRYPIPGRDGWRTLEANLCENGS